MKIELTGINKRVREVIDRFADGNVSKFADLLNKSNTGVKKFSQQGLNRLLNFDKKAGRFPMVQPGTSEAILKSFPTISRIWLLAGEGDMLKSTKERQPSENRPTINSTAEDGKLEYQQTQDFESKYYRQLEDCNKALMQKIEILAKNATTILSQQETIQALVQGNGSGRDAASM